MKKNNFIFYLLFITTILQAQTKTSKLGITAGFGFQQYNGDLGNGFYNFKTSSYGVGSAQIASYLTPSFDAGIMFSIGDYGYCQTEEEANKEVPFSDRCPGCLGRVGIGNLNSRMISGGLFIRYKLANGYILKEDSKLSPYLYAGASFNQLTDRMKMNCVTPGNYYTINAGAGINYNLSDRFVIGYNVGFGRFTSDKVDLQVRCSKDMYMQNTLHIGINIF